MGPLPFSCSPLPLTSPRRSTVSAPPGDTHRLFVLEQNGLIRVIEDGVLLPTPALNIESRVAPAAGPDQP